MTIRCQPPSPAAIGLLLLLSTLLPLLGAARALAEPAEPVKTESPYFFIDDGDPTIDRLPLESTEVRFDVSGVITDVRVTQVYRNAGTRPISASYVFPASVRAAVHGMRMTVGDETVEAVVQERKRAERTFDEARREGKRASLLQQHRPNVFSMQVANVMPGDRIEVELRYTELLVPEEGVYEFVYPTVVGPRYGGGTDASDGKDGFVSSPYLDEREGPTHRLHLEGHLATGVPLQRIETPSHRSTIERPSPSVADVALGAGEADRGDRDFVLRYVLAGEEVSPGLLLYGGENDGDEKFFMLTVQPPARVAPAEMPAREYVFVLDVSGSMHGFPLDTAKGVLRELAAGLTPRDRFNVMFFSGGSEVLWPASRAATRRNLAAAMSMIERADGGGGTEMLSALEHALAMPAAPGASRNFIVVTDGYVAAERDLFTHIRDHLGEANVYAFGIGSSVNRYLVDGIARAGLGQAFVVLEPGEARPTAQRFRRYIEAPVLTDVELRARGFDIYDVEPATLPDVLASRPLVVHGKWRGDAKGTLELSGTRGDGRFTTTLAVADVTPDPRHAALQRLWARTRITEVADFAFGQETDAERREVTALGLRYNLLTAHTSFVAVSHRVANPSGASQSVDQPLPLPIGVSNAAVGAPIMGAPEPELWLLLLVLAIMILLATLHGRHARGHR